MCASKWFKCVKQRSDFVLTSRERHSMVWISKASGVRKESLVRVYQELSSPRILLFLCRSNNKCSGSGCQNRGEAAKRLPAPADWSGAESRRQDVADVRLRTAAVQEGFFALRNGDCIKVVQKIIYILPNYLLCV